MAAPDPEIQEFVKRLILGTRKGQAKWTASTDAWFDLEADGTSVVIRSDSEEENHLDHPYTLMVTNAKGMTLVRVSTLVGEIYADWEAELAELFKVARNQALGIQDALQGLTSKLQLPEIPKVADDDIPF